MCKRFNFIYWLRYFFEDAGGKHVGEKQKFLTLEASLAEEKKLVMALQTKVEALTQTNETLGKNKLSYVFENIRKRLVGANNTVVPPVQRLQFSPPNFESSPQPKISYWV